MLTKIINANNKTSIYDFEQQCEQVMLKKVNSWTSN